LGPLFPYYGLFSRIYGNDDDVYKRPFELLPTKYHSGYPRALLSA
jgi:hypothetical protein